VGATPGFGGRKRQPVIIPETQWARHMLRRASGDEGSYELAAGHTPLDSSGNLPDAPPWLAITGVYHEAPNQRMQLPAAEVFSRL